MTAPTVDELTDLRARVADAALRRSDAVIALSHAGTSAITTPSGAIPKAEEPRLLARVRAASVELVEAERAFIDVVSEYRQAVTR